MVWEFVERACVNPDVGLLPGVNRLESAKYELDNNVMVFGRPADILQKVKEGKLCVYIS